MFLKSTKKLLYNFFPAKKLALFVFLAILVLGFSVKVSFATIIFSDTQKETLAKSYGLNSDQITNLANKDITFETFYKNYNYQVSNGKSGSDAAKTTYDLMVADVGTGVDVITGNQALDNEVGFTSALKGLGFAVSESILFVVIGVLGVFVSFAKYLVVFSAQVLDLTLNPVLYSFTSNNMIVQGWTVVRDVCNLFFLLVLLFIAICTILKIEKYHAKKTLLTLIIMALLINFSKPITIFVFDGSQLLMNFFLNQMGGTGTGKESGSALITKASAISDFIYQSLPGYWKSKDTSLNLAVQYIFAATFLFMLAVSYLVTALMLIIRIVAIMMLIIVSPLAFFAAIIPDLSKMSSKWWSSLFEYSYYGPAAAFFLLLATKLEEFLPHLSNTVETTAYSAKDMTTTIYNITHYLTVLVFLYASIFMAKQFGGAAGAAIVGNANRVMKWAGGLSKGGGMWGSLARGTAQVTGATNMYKGVKGGIAQQPVLRMLTKEGREARSKESQEKWAEKIAPFNISNVKKKSKELENAPKATVDAGVKSGKAEHIFEAARRGDLTAAQLKTQEVRTLMEQYPDFEKAIYKNLRDSGKADVQYADFMDRNPGVTGDAAYDETFGKMSLNQLAEKGNLVDALKEDAKGGGGNLLIHRLADIKDEKQIQQMQSRATNKETYRTLEKLARYRAAKNAGWSFGPPPTGTPPVGWTGDLTSYLTT